MERKSLQGVEQGGKELTYDEVLVEEVLAIFRRRLEKAKRKAEESAFAANAVFAALDDMCIDAEEIPTNAENASNLKEAICCFLDYGEYSLAGIMREVRKAYREG